MEETLPWEEEEVRSSWDKLLCAALHREESLVAWRSFRTNNIAHGGSPPNVVIPKSRNMAKSMAGVSKNPPILFAMFLRGSTSDPAGIDMVPMPVCVSRP